MNKYHENKITCHIPYRMRDSGQIVLWSGSTLSLRPDPPTYTCNEGGNHSNKPKFCLEPSMKTVVSYHYFVTFEYILEWNRSVKEGLPMYRFYLLTNSP